jgi:hypothetical protein
MRTLRKQCGLVVLGFVTLAACDTGVVTLPVTVVVPPAVPTVSLGVLRLSLWVYDPMLADAPASLADVDSVRFSHQAGATSQFRLRVSADVPGRQKYYITVAGYELSAECEKFILWDGQEGTGTPREVVMRSVSTPTCNPAASFRSSGYR